MNRPAPDLWAMFTSSATRYRVPATLLAAIAFQESGFNAKAVGTKTSGGWNALGIMQLSPKLAKSLGVDPLDPAAAIDGAAKHIADLYRATDHNTESVIAAYVWGIGNVNRAQERKQRYPTRVRSYVSAVVANRIWLQEQAKPVGSTIQERLMNAIVGLRAANPTLEEPRILFESFRTFLRASGTIPDVEVIRYPVLMAAWREYARLYDLAPVTGSGTPQPEAIAPQIWTQVLNLIGDEPQGQLTFAADPDGIVRLPPVYVTAPTANGDSGGMMSLGLVMAGFVAWWLLSSTPQRRTVLRGFV